MQGKNKPLLRYLETDIRRLIAKRQSGLILGPRQVGKTTLVQNLLSGVDNRLEYFFQIPSVRLEAETDPGRIIREVEAESGQPIVFVDEAQKVPEVFDAAQYLIDKKSFFHFDWIFSQKTEKKRCQSFARADKKVLSRSSLVGRNGTYQRKQPSGTSSQKHQ